MILYTYWHLSCVVDAFKLNYCHEYNVKILDINNTTFCSNNSTVVFWVDTIYYGDEGATVNVIVHKEGYLGSGTESVSKLIYKAIK